MPSTEAQRRWNVANRSNTVTHALTLALKGRVENPYRLLAIAVVGMAFYDGLPVHAFWADMADIDAGAMGFRVYA